MGNIIYQLGITKLRFGSNNAWGPWQYEAIPDEKGGQYAGPTKRVESIDALARQIAELPGAEDIELVPILKGVKRPYVSLASGSLTQWGFMGDEELGGLAILVQRYAQEKKSEGQRKTLPRSQQLLN